MSNKNKKSLKRRPYNLKARARRQEAVHKRITMAAVRLHESLGPARTTMQAIADMAGVRRATVYNHFPTELDLIDACSSHWFTENPPPNQTAWIKIKDPVRRTGRALLDMYEYYDQGQDMLGNVLRDAAVVPAMDEIRRQKWLPLLEGIVEILVPGWSGAADRSDTSSETDPADHRKRPDNDSRVSGKELRASMLVALDFFTWQTLVDSGLSTRRAARLAAAWIKAGAKTLI